MINNIIRKKPLPKWQRWKHQRLVVCRGIARAIDVLFHEGKVGETYNIGGHKWNYQFGLGTAFVWSDGWSTWQGSRWITAAHHLCEGLATISDMPLMLPKLKENWDGYPNLLLSKDWKTIQWYLDNETWLDHVTSGSYQAYYQKAIQSGLSALPLKITIPGYYDREIAYVLHVWLVQHLGNYAVWIAAKGKYAFCIWGANGKICHSKLFFQGWWQSVVRCC